MLLLDQKKVDLVALNPNEIFIGGRYHSLVPLMKESMLIHTGTMKVLDCNNHIKSTSEFFSGGCAVNILTNKYNPLGM
ncbi:hypothetical protein O3P69_005711 [Scylla paramamosain]|uniref:Uncharacterized protein n=1 Tax=Scylla paramamosain TaxID=85552 RepID=A0AAW0U6S2_SCYPA